MDSETYNEMMDWMYDDEYSSSPDVLRPIPNYHNVRTALKSIYLFYSNRRRYIWKGWCVKDEFKEDDKK